MLPIADDPITAIRGTDPAMVPRSTIDPIRLVVQSLLAIYLSPVILAVCVIGATSILIIGAARMVGNRINPEAASRPARLVEGRNQPRLIQRESRSRSGSGR